MNKEEYEAFRKQLKLRRRRDAIYGWLLILAVLLIGATITYISYTITWGRLLSLLTCTCE